MGWWRTFQKCIFHHFFLTFFLYNWTLQNTIFANLQNKLQILNKSIKTLQWYIICHILTSNMGLRGGRGVKLTPPQGSIFWFSSTPARIGLMKIHRNIYSLEFAFDLSKQSIILKIIVFHEIVYVSLKASQSDL